MRVLITGAAGFIGFHTAQRLLDGGHDVLGLDNLNDYYDVALKRARLTQLTTRDTFAFAQTNLEDRDSVASLFSEHAFDAVINLAAQPGVRYAAENPHAYADTNISGFLNVLEGCRHTNVQHLVFASSSSVYGANTTMPYSVHQTVDHPVSFYAATKKANELMAHSYAHLYGLAVTGLRFFTVYGPWGRPDMSPFLFTRKILAGEPIDVFNNGNHQRDFTYISDIVEGVVRVLDHIPTGDPTWSSDTPDPAASTAPYKLYNIGNNKPVELMHFIKCIEGACGKEAIKNYLPLQPGDVPATYADIEALTAAVGFKPTTFIEDGVVQFVNWYRAYYDV